MVLVVAGDKHGGQTAGRMPDTYEDTVSILFRWVRRDQRLSSEVALIAFGSGQRNL